MLKFQISNYKFQINDQYPIPKYQWGCDFLIFKIYLLFGICNLEFARLIYINRACVHPHTAGKSNSGFFIGGLKLHRFLGSRTHDFLDF